MSRLVEQPLGLEDADPGIDADQEARPERQDHERDEDRARAGRGARHGVGHRVADQEQERRRDERDAHRGEARLPVEVVGPQRLEILEVEPEEELAPFGEAAAPVEHRRVGRLRRHRVRHADLHDDREGHEEEDEEPEIGRPDDEGAPGAAAESGEHRLYPVSTIAASGAKKRWTRCSQSIGGSTARDALARETRRIEPSSSRTR